MKYLKPLLLQFKALNTRERLLTIAAFLGVIYFLFDFALIRPQVIKSRELRAQLVQQDVELVAARQSLQALSVAAMVDPLAKQRAQRDELRATIAEADAVLARASADIRIGEVIRSMIASRPGLTLVLLKTLPTETYFQGPQAAAPATAASAAAPATAASGVAVAVAPLPPVPNLYRHGIEVTVQGSYPALVSYLQDLERNSNGMFWGNVSMDVKGYPESTLRLLVYTLSSRPELPLG